MTWKYLESECFQKLTSHSKWLPNENQQGLGSSTHGYTITHLDRSTDFVYLRDTPKSTCHTTNFLKVMGEITDWNSAYKCIYLQVLPLVSYSSKLGIYFS